MPLEIRTIDAQDETALRAWWEVGRAATAERPGSPFPAWEVSRTALPADNPERDTTLIGAFDGDTVVGAVLFLMPLNENLRTCAGPRSSTTWAPRPTATASSPSTPSVPMSTSRPPVGSWAC